MALAGSAEINALTGRIIGCAIRVHRRFGPGLFEKPCARAMALELAKNQLQYDAEVSVRATYDDRDIGVGYKMDFVVESSLIPVDDRPTKVCFRHVRPDRQGSLIARERLLAPGKPCQRIAAVEVDLGEVGVGRKRAVETFDRGLMAPQCSQGIAAVGVRRGEVGA